MVDDAQQQQQYQYHQQQQHQELSESENIEEEEDECCPICIEPLDEEDQCFLPCPCNYKVCMFCVRRIQTEFDGRCPGCRRDYKEENFRFEKQENRNHRGTRKPRTSKRNHDINGHGKPGKANPESYESAPSAHNPAHDHDYHGHNENGGLNGNNNSFSRKDLSNVRVVQRNLVYLIGLAPSIAKEEILRSNDFFGQYGKTIKIVVSRNSGDKIRVADSGGRSQSCSAYITFARDEDAKMAIQAVNGFWYDNHMIRASYGTTKYCNMFLRGLQCNNPECLYLHKLGDESASFTKEEMQQGRSQFHDMTHVSGTNSHLEGADSTMYKGPLPARGTNASGNVVDSTKVLPHQGMESSNHSSPNFTPTSTGGKAWTNNHNSSSNSNSSKGGWAAAAAAGMVRHASANDALTTSSTPNTTIKRHMSTPYIQEEQEEESLLSSLGGIELDEYEKQNNLGPIGSPSSANGFPSRNIKRGNPFAPNNHQQQEWLRNVLPHANLSFGHGLTTLQHTDENDSDPLNLFQAANPPVEEFNVMSLMGSLDAQHQEQLDAYHRQPKFHLVSNVHRGNVTNATLEQEYVGSPSFDAQKPSANDPIVPPSQSRNSNIPW